MQSLRLARAAVAFALLSVGACCADSDGTEESCEQTGECIDRTCQPDSGNGEAICRPDCTQKGQWLCSYGHTAVHHCDGAAFSRFSACAGCTTSGSSFQDAFNCESEKSRSPGTTGFNPIRIPFAIPGDPCSEGSSRACVIDGTGNRVCAEAHHACAVDKTSILICMSGVWQIKEACSSPKSCDSYNVYVGGGPRGVFQTFECVN